MKTKIAFLLAVIAFTACNNSNDKEKEKIIAAQWLLGKWETKTDFGTYTETWQQANDSTLSGKACFLKGTDTLHNESIELQQTADKFIYKTIILGQHNDKAIVFESSVDEENELVFENPKNDYPQKISYKKVSTDSIVTEISGMQFNKPSTEKYTLVKTK